MPPPPFIPRVFRANDGTVVVQDPIHGDYVVVALGPTAVMGMGYHWVLSEEFVTTNTALSFVELKEVRP